MPIPGSANAEAIRFARRLAMMRLRLVRWGPAAGLLTLLAAILPPGAAAQGVTTSAVDGFITQENGQPIEEANIVAVHLPSGTQYRAVARTGGAYTIANMRIGGPYRVTASYIGFQPESKDSVFLTLGQTQRVDLRLEAQAVQLQEIAVTGEEDKVLNPDRTGAATFISPQQVEVLPSIKRSTRDLTRLDPRNDGNFSFAGRNWLYNNVSLDGSYFNNPFGLDDPAPGGQTNAEPVPYDAVEQVEVSVAPFDVREGGFTGANINTVTKSGTNEFRASLYSFGRTEDLEGNSVRGEKVSANPDLKYIQSGISFSGPIIRDKLFFFVNGELERNDDPGSNFVASVNGQSGFGISRVDADTMDMIRERMITAYDYDTGPYQDYINQTDNNKILAKLDWNINPSNNLTFRWNFLDAKRDLPVHPFAISFNNTGRGPNESSLPFQNSGYAINNDLNSFALELNSRSSGFANRFFASYNRFRDSRQPFSRDFPTIEIGQDGVTYTTIGHEPFSIHNVLDQDVWQLTNNFTWFRGRHSLTFGANFETFGFFNSFNLFRNGLFQLPAELTFLRGGRFESVQDFLAATDPSNPDQIQFNSYVGTGPFKGENIDVGQLSVYAQDEFLSSERLNLTLGVRVDFPMYFTDPVDNPFSRGLTALDENRDPEVVDQSKLPGTKALFSPRFGFNWNASGDRRTQIRGGTGIFTGRVPFVWVGNNISNPGENPNLPGDFNAPPDTVFTSDDAILKQSFDLNAMDPDFKWPQTWVSDLAIDQDLGKGFLGTLEVIYGNDLHNVVVRNADLVPPVRTLPDGRPYFGGVGNNELNNDPDNPGDDGAGIYVIDNTSEGHNFNFTAQLRKTFVFGLNATVAYSFTEAKNILKSTEIAFALWQNLPVQGDPNNPEVSFSEFGQRHRIIGGATFIKPWSASLRTSIGVFVEVAEGGRFAGAGGNRYSFIYSGDVNGDGTGGNDLIYIPRDQSEIIFDPCTSGCGSNVTPAQQWAALDAFIKQDKYLDSHRGEIAERFGEVNPWYSNIDLKILQDFAVGGLRQHNFQVSVDVLNVANLINSDWGVRKVASASAQSPLRFTRFDDSGAPVFNFTGPRRTFIDDPSIFSRWRAQLGLRYFFQ
jgi:Carboxypeptidase regulatory-like domain